MTANSQDLLNQFGRFMQTFHQRGFSTFSKRGQQFWAKQPQRGQMIVLFLLNQKGQLTNSQIVDELDIRPSSVSVMVKKLVEEGFAERHDSTEDKRVSLISLTKKGREAITSSHDFKMEFADELFDALSPEEQETLDKLLKKLTDGLNEKFAKWDDGEERPDFLDSMPNAFFKGQRPGWNGFKGNNFGGQRPQNGPFGVHPNGFDPNQDDFDPNRHN